MRAHLAADQAYAAPVETSTQVQIGVFLTVPGADHDPPAEAGDGDGLIEGQGVAGELVGQVCSVGAMLRLQAGLQARQHIIRAGIETGVRPQLTGALPAEGIAIHGDHARQRQTHQ